MTQVKDILAVKGGDVWSVTPQSMVYDAMKLMAEKGVGALMVILNGEVLGVISERDYARKVILQGRASRTTQVREIMSTQVLYAHPEQNIEQCMVLMTEKRVRHLPVWDEGRLLGVISIGDLVKSIITDQKFMIEQLERYITS
ncbi:MAG TPA: CBS domain-containing protein [Candidatus Binatia bacterium]|jgi:CBS domain-containing protein